MSIEPRFLQVLRTRRGLKRSSPGLVTCRNGLQIAPATERHNLDC